MRNGECGMRSRGARSCGTTLTPRFRIPHSPLRICSRPQLVKRPRKRDRLPDVRDAADPRDRPLDAQPEARVDERAVLAEVQVPAVRLFGELLLPDAREQPVVVVLALASPDDLPVALGRQHVVVQHGARVGGVFLHIEGFHPLRVVVNQHGAVVLLGEQRFLLPPDVPPPLHPTAQAPELFHGVGVGSPRERRADALERLQVPPELGQLRLPPLEGARYDVAHELLLELHVVVGVVPGDFGLHHPELAQVAARLRLLGAERRPEAVHFAERGGRRFDVELARLRQVRGAEVEVLGGEEVPRRFADRAGEDRRVDEDEAALVEEVADRLDHLVAHAGDGHLVPAPQPQVAVLEQEGGAVLLGRDWEIVARSDDLQVRGRELDAARRAPVGAHDAADFERRLLREPAERLPGRVRHVALGENRLQVARAVADDDERDLPARAGGHHPAADGDRLADELRQRFDAMNVWHRRGILVTVVWAVNATGCASGFVPAPKPGPPRQDVSWPAYLGTPRHDASAAESLNADPRPLWHADLGRAVRGSPAIGETVIAVGVADRMVALVDRATGQALWRTRVAGTVHGGPLLESDRLYVATETGLVLRLATEGGKVAWRRHLSGAIRAGPVPTPDGIAVATTADTLYLLDRATGQVRARLPTPGAVLAVPAADGSRLYCGTTGGRVLAVDLPALAVAWDVAAGDAVFGAPAVAGDTVYALARNGTLLLIPEDRPSEARSLSLDIVATAGPTPLASGVLVASVAGDVLLVDRASGAVLWRIQLDGPIEQPPLVRDRQLVVVAGRGDIHSYR